MIVRNHMLPRGSEGSPSETQSWDLIEQGVSLMKDDTLGQALPMFSSKLEYIPVVTENEGGGRTLIGALYHIDTLRAYNRALVEAHEEEHG
jgi:CIC family chloride channel protein